MFDAIFPAAREQKKGAVYPRPKSRRNENDKILYIKCQQLFDKYQLNLVKSLSSDNASKDVNYAEKAPLIRLRFFQSVSWA
jgi:hypothetical protein